jgi:excinuclease UvrABC nuclease subunit
MKYMKNLHWQNCNLSRNQAFKVKESAGVYVVKKVTRIMGLPLPEKIVYVGKSNNLQRRFKEHCNIKSEHNLGLLKVNLNEELEFWFSATKESEITDIESHLVRELDPLTNIVRYKQND